MLRQKKFYIIIIFISISIIFSVGCIQRTSENQVSNSHTEEVKSTSTWRDMELTDIATGKKFKISDFKGQPVLLESFAVWCPTCLEQQKITKELRLKEGDKIIHISLDTDPNEDEERVREHIETHGFDWYFAISPIELTKDLIDEFSQKIVFAPGVPMILICEDQSTRFLKRGIKSTEDLLIEVKNGC